MSQKIFRGILILLTVVVMINGLAYLSLDKDIGVLPSKPQALIDSWFYMTMFYFHTSFGAVALGTGVVQLLFTLTKYKSHRIIGRIYMVAVLFSGIGGLYIAFFANHGLIAQVGFWMLAVSWLSFSYLAYFHVRKGNIITHKKWILRSMALTFSAITLRLILPSMLIGGVPMEIAYPIISWGCWVPNLIVLEFLFYFQKLKKNPI